MQYLVDSYNICGIILPNFFTVKTLWNENSRSTCTPHSRRQRLFLLLHAPAKEFISFFFPVCHSSTWHECISGPGRLLTSLLVSFFPPIHTQVLYNDPISVYWVKNKMVHFTCIYVGKRECKKKNSPAICSACHNSGKQQKMM